MSISSTAQIYIRKVLDLWRSAPDHVVAAYRECWPHKFDERAITRSLIDECAVLDSDSGFDNAACFPELWEEALMELASIPPVTYQPYMALVQNERVIATFNNVEAPLPEDSFMALLHRLAWSYPNARLIGTSGPVTH